MLGSILAPVGDGRHRQKWLVLAALYIGGSTIAAAALGGLLSVLARSMATLGVVPSWPRFVAAALALLYVPRLLGWSQRPGLPQSRWQVPQRWLFERRRWVTALLYGLILGSGLPTRVVVPTYWVLVVWSLTLPGHWSSIAIWTLYGFSRSVPLLWQAGRATEESRLSDGLRFNAVLLRNSARMRLANALLLLSVALASTVGWAVR